LPLAAGRYELLDEIAHGGMGVIYRATDTVLGREVAVKMLQKRFEPDSEAGRRFVGEARIAGQLQHPGIPAVHDLGTMPDGRPFLAMRLINGRTLDELLKRRDPSSPNLIAVFEQVCHAVGYAHAHCVVHRDLKPANVMVGAFGEVQVMDWGLAKVLSPGRERERPESDPDETTAAVTAIDSGQDDSDATRAGSVLGTPSYMPPEQAIGAVDQIDAQSDVFGLGAILCAVLTGKPPYVGADAESTRQLAARAKLGDAFARLDSCGAEPELVALCKRSLSVEKTQRPAEAGAVARAVADLRAAADERARKAELDRVKAEAEAREQRKRRRVQLALAAAVGLLVVAGGSFAWWRSRQATVEQARLSRSADAVDTLLSACEDALRADDSDRASLALQAAIERAAESGWENLDARFTQCRADLAVLRDLDTVDQFRVTTVDSKFPPTKQTASQLRAAFEKFGVLPGVASAEASAQRIASSSARERLIVALDRWLLFEPSADVRAILQQVDPDAYRDLVRDAWAARNATQPRELADRPEALRQPPGFASVQGDSRNAVPVERRRQLLRAALTRRPGHLGLLMALSYTSGGEDKIRWSQAAVAVAPRHAAAHFELADALRQAGGDLDGALAEYREALRLDPAYHYAHINVAYLLVRKRDYEGAIAASNEVIRLDPTLPHGYVNLGYALYESGDLDGAIKATEDAIRVDPTAVIARANLGRLLLLTKGPDAAIAQYKEAMRLDPKSPHPHLALAELAEKQNQLDRALAEYNEAVRLDPTFAKAYLGAGWVLQQKGDLHGAAVKYKESIKLDRNDALAHNNMGHVLEQKGDLDGAIAEYKEALRLDPKQKYALVNLPRAERMRELLPRLPDILAGRTEPKSPAEAIDFAQLLKQPPQKRFAAAARLYEKAFAADPKLADTLRPSHRYSAACYAARAARGDGIDAPSHQTERAALRGKALAWLRADLAMRMTLAASAGPANREMLSHWLTDSDLTETRPGRKRAGWTPEEVAAWDKLWLDVKAARAKATKPVPKPPDK
jgi:serine/threonine protein kinase/Flp pilus assembly protein TadD